MEESDDDLQIAEVTKITLHGFGGETLCRKGLLFPIQQLK